MNELTGFADPQVIEIGFYILIALSGLFFLRKNDELLIVVLLFFYSACLNRYDKIADGTAEFVYVAYAVNIFTMNAELAYSALIYLFTGTAVFCTVYMLLRFNAKEVVWKRDDNELLAIFVRKHQMLILGGFSAIFVVSLVLLGAALSTAASGGSLAMGNSYQYYFGFALAGMIILMFLAFRQLHPKRDFMIRYLFLALIVLAGIYTYDINNRFRFLSWIVAVGIIMTKEIKPARKLILYTVGGGAVALIFSFTGAMRMGNVSLKSNFSDMYEAAITRINSAEDQNMLDGMMMIMQVYPYYLPHAYGMEHIEILLRPIPRSWWPDKPVGSYINKLHLNDNMEGGATVGISPSLYGSFYAEGGIIGVILFSILYALLFNRIQTYASQFGSDLQFIVKGMAISGMVPLLRGGDLPGIVAFVGMAYWPVFLFLNRYGFWLRNYRRRMIVKEQAEQKPEENLIQLQRSLRPETLKA